MSFSTIVHFQTKGWSILDINTYQAKPTINLEDKGPGMPLSSNFSGKSVFYSFFRKGRGFLIYGKRQ